MHHVIRLKVYYIDMNYIYIFAQFKKKVLYGCDRLGIRVTDHVI